MTVDVGLREPPQVSGGDDEHGHLEELRVDPIALMRRVRDECGDVGSSAWPTATSCCSTGAEANELFFRAPEEVLDQAEAYPFMTPDLRRRRGLRRPPRAPARDAPQPGPARQVHAGPRRHDRRRGRGAWWRAGPTTGTIDLLDWFAELTIYTSSACLIGTQVPPRARPPLRRALPRPRAGHRRHRLRRPLRAHRELPPPRRRPAGARRPGAGDHGPPRRRPRRHRRRP